MLYTIDILASKYFILCYFFISSIVLLVDFSTSMSNIQDPDWFYYSFTIYTHTYIIMYVYMRVGWLVPIKKTQCIYNQPNDIMKSHLGIAIRLVRWNVA